MRRNPFDELEELLDRISQQVEEGMAQGSGFPVPGQVDVDVADAGDEYVVTADVPGYETGDIELTFSDGTLRIEAHREETDEVGDGKYLRRERTRRSVNRRLRLPEPIDEDAASASYDRGVLTVTLPKESTSAESRHIDID
jgi:HSP20 family protein